MYLSAMIFIGSRLKLLESEVGHMSNCGRVLFCQTGQTQCTAAQMWASFSTHFRPTSVDLESGLCKSSGAAKGHIGMQYGIEPAFLCLEDTPGDGFFFVVPSFNT